MLYQRASLETCAQAREVAVSIDVLRAFTTAAYAFAAGAEKILLVGTVETALALRAQTPGSLIMGEVEGLPVPGFDFSNSPSAIAGQDLAGRVLIQRTSAGTQGVVRSTAARLILAASLVCAKATARLLRHLDPPEVAFIITGGPLPLSGPHPQGDEDAACADYLEALLRGEDPPVAPYIERVWTSPAGQLFAHPHRPEFPLADLQYSTAVNRFDFAMQVERQGSLNVLHKVSSLPNP